MTTRMQITNIGPEYAAVWYYDQKRAFKPLAHTLKPGESIEVDVWDGHLPLLLPAGTGPATTPGESPSFFPCPPAATYPTGEGSTGAAA